MRRAVALLLLGAAVLVSAQSSTLTAAPTPTPVGPPTIACGGLLGLQCPSTKQFCYYSDGSCGAADQLGTCTDIPDVCYLIYAPVCGCDGNTYGNDCLAKAAGTSVASQGECPPPCSGEGAFCGGIAGIPCKGRGYFCKFNKGECRYIADVGGKCAAKPQACPFIFKPVCGCDGKQYSNECLASANGMSVACDGKCPCPQYVPPPADPAPAPATP